MIDPARMLKIIQVIEAANELARFVRGTVPPHIPIDGLNVSAPEVLERFDALERCLKRLEAEK